jgi:myo-inositol-1(or 4)-monophosphatase
MERDMHDREPFDSAPPDLRELLALASDLALQAGGVPGRAPHQALAVQTKSSPTDVVSQVDEEAERLITERLRRERPGDALLAEEGSLLHGDSGVRWIVDPLDGTTNYVYGYPAYAASIAVEVGGEVAVGVVYDSSAGHLYRAVVGHGAVRDDLPLRARESDDLSQALVATGFSYDALQRERQGAVVAAALGRIRDIRRGGTAALDLCRVAAGEVDAYWELDLSPWDYAAGTLIAREAGAAVEHLQAVHGRGPAVVAAHPRLMPALLGLLREAGALAGE